MMIPWLRADCTRQHPEGCCAAGVLGKADEVAQAVKRQLAAPAMVRKSRVRKAMFKALGWVNAVQRVSELAQGVEAQVHVAQLLVCADDGGDGGLSGHFVSSGLRVAMDSTMPAAQLLWFEFH